MPSFAPISPPGNAPTGSIHMTLTHFPPTVCPPEGLTPGVFGRSQLSKPIMSDEGDDFEEFEEDDFDDDFDDDFEEEFEDEYESDEDDGFAELPDDFEGFDTEPKSDENSDSEDG